MAVIITDAKGRIEWVNAAFAALTGFDLSEAEGRHPGELLQGPDTDPAVVTRMRNALARQSGFNVEILNYHKNGSPYRLHLTVDPLFDRDGKLTHFIGAQTGLDEREEAEATLRLTNSLLATTLDATADGILVVGSDRKITRFNRRFAEMWHIPHDVFDGSDLTPLGFVLDQLKFPADFLAKVEHLYAHPEKESFDVLEFADGRTFERYSRPQWIGGKPAGRIWSFRDISDRKHGEDRQRALHQISEAAHSASDLPDLFRRIHEIVGSLLPANNLYVALYDQVKDELTFPYFVDERDPAPIPRKPGSGLTERVLRTGLPWLVSPKNPESTIEADKLPLYGSKSLDWLGVPLFANNRTIGVLAVQTYTGSHRYTDKDQALLQFVSDQVAAAIARKQAERALKESEELHRLLAENASDVIWTLDMKGRRTYISPSIERLFGYTVAEALQQSPDSAAMPGSGPMILEYLASVQTGNAAPQLSVELEMPCKDGSIRWMETHAACMFNAEREKVGILGVTRDISERKHQAARIEHLAFYDPLTGLPNRALFRDRLNHAIERAKRHGRRIACLFLDLDRFKEINDSLGHAIGDQALVEVAHRLQASTRQEETLARLGGDEFVLIAEETHQLAMELTAERLLKALAEPIALTDHIFSVGASIGIAFFPEDGLTSDDLFKHTDIAMYCAKISGGGYRFYQPEMGADLAKRLDIARRLGLALEANELELHYQPQISLKTGAMVGAEALLRWHDSDRGWVSPSEFVPIAEERGMMGPIGDWVMRTACHQVKLWREEGYAFPERLAVNLSARQLHAPGIGRRLLSIVQDDGLTPNLFELELTESSMMTDPEDAVAIMESLGAAGFSLAIDDFGTGYSSLSYLKRFAVDKIKIDISFVREMLSDRDDHAIVKGIISMAQSLGLKTTAEGVEHAGQAKVLRELGCDFVQGYYFGRPLPAGIFQDTWLHRLQDV
jgi:diguanylate cyclase (GGDEF)-like protein/PAS domain S-box-containing protein